MEKLTPSKLIGLPKLDAIKLIKSYGLDWRITCEDGKYNIHTQEINANRFNLEIKEGKITNAAIG